MKETIHIAIGFDDNYVMPYGIAMISICRNTDADIYFHAFVSDTLSKQNIDKLTEIVQSYNKKIIFYDVDHTLYEGLHETEHIVRSAYNRFQIPNQLSEDIHKVLYMDGDIIVKKSLVDLWQIDLEEDCPLAAAIDARCSGVIQHNAIDLPLDMAYYNAGVMLLNLDYWRKYDISKKCIDYIKTSHCPWMDQDAINHVLGNKIKKIHLRYNLQMAFVRLPESNWHVEKEKYFKEVYEAKANPVILHYSERIKPWHDSYPCPEEWLKYKTLSPWKDIPLETRFRPADNTRYILSKLEQENTSIVEKYAPAYLLLLSKSIKKHPKLLWILNKLFWVLMKTLRLLKC